jgi:hypothetical protein
MGVQTLKRYAFATTVLVTVLVVILPFVGGGGPSIASAMVPAAASFAEPNASVGVVPDSNGQQVAAPEAPATSTVTVDTEHVAQKPLLRIAPISSAASVGTTQRRAALAQKGQSCPSNIGGATRSAPGRVSAGGVHGTTSEDLSAFAHKFNAIRVANCIPPIPLANFKYDSCMETRLFWMAEDPSTNPASAWGHMGSKRSDGVPSVGCDGNLAGGSGNTGVTVAQKWWDSLPHRASLYRPSTGGSMAHVCIIFAMTHGGIPNEPYSFTRAAARWVAC